MGITPRTFQSKTDRWLVAVLMVHALTLAIVGTVTILALSGRWRWVLALSLFVGAACELWMLRSTRYILEDQHIRVLCGPFRRLIPIRQIRSVTPTRSALAAPALSLDRLRIDYAGGLILISPLAKDEFLAALSERRALSAGVIQTDPLPFGTKS